MSQRITPETSSRRREVSAATTSVVDLRASPSETLGQSSSSEDESDLASSTSSDEERDSMAYGPLPIPIPTTVREGPLSGMAPPPTTRYVSALQKSFEARLSTFPQTWPHGSRDAKENAKSGFYYTGFGYRIKCAFCGIAIDRQNAYTEIVPRHYNLAPRCLALNLTYQLRFDTMVGAVYRSLGIRPEDIPDSDQFSENTRAAVERVERASSAVDTSGRRIGEPVVSNLWNINPLSRKRVFGARTESTPSPDPEARPNMECKVCLSKTSCMVFFPCKHLATCRDCAKKLSNCCICREKIKAATAVFF